MSVATKEWKDGEAGGTPITAAELNRIESDIAEATKPPNWSEVTNKPTIPTVPAAMTAAEAKTGTATTNRTISPKVLADEIDRRVAEAIAALGD